MAQFGRTGVRPTGAVSQPQQQRPTINRFQALANGLEKLIDNAKEQQREAKRVQLEQEKLSLQSAQIKRDVANDNLNLAKANASLVAEYGKKFERAADGLSFELVDATQERASMLRAIADKEALIRELSRPTRDEDIRNLAEGFRQLGVGGERPEAVAKAALGPEGATIKAAIQETEKTEGKLKTQEAKTLADKEKDDRRYAAQVALQDRKFANELELAGYEFDRREGLLVIGKEIKKNIIDYTRSLGIDPNKALTAIALLEQNPFFLRDKNKERLLENKEPYGSVEDYVKDLMNKLSGKPMAEPIPQPGDEINPDDLRNPK